MNLCKIFMIVNLIFIFQNIKFFLELPISWDKHMLMICIFHNTIYTIWSSRVFIYFANYKFWVSFWIISLKKEFLVYKINREYPSWKYCGFANTRHIHKRVPDEFRYWQPWWNWDRRPLPRCGLAHNWRMLQRLHLQSQPQRRPWRKLQRRRCPCRNGWAAPSTSILCLRQRNCLSYYIFFPLLFCNYSSIMWIIGAWVQRKIYFLLFRNLLFVIHFVVLMEGVIFVVQLSNNPMYFSTRNYKLRETSMHWLDAYEWNLEVYIIAYHFALQTNFIFLNNSVLFFPKAKKIIIAY